MSVIVMDLSGTPSASARLTRMDIAIGFDSSSSLRASISAMLSDVNTGGTTSSAKTLSSTGIVTDAAR